MVLKLTAQRKNNLTLYFPFLRNFVSPSKCKFIFILNTSFFTYSTYAMFGWEDGIKKKKKKLICEFFN